MKLNLSPTSKAAQRCAATGSNNSSLPFAQLVPARARAGKPRRIALPAIPARLVLRGDRHYLRALRAAEMAEWQAGQPMTVSHSFTLR
jgi:hypothetical protein